MERSPLPERSEPPERPEPSEPVLTEDERARLAAIARAAVVAAVRGRSYAPPEEALTGALALPGAAFVSLHSAGGELRGCIGSIEARRPLGLDVAENACAAVTRDTRFEPVEEAELASIEIDLSLLTPPEPIPAATRAELLAALRPGVDGLVIEENGRRATFLPVVWEQLPAPEAFLAHLEKKAGLEPGSWSNARRASRYRVEPVAAGRASPAP